MIKWEDKVLSSPISLSPSLSSPLLSSSLLFSPLLSSLFFALNISFLARPALYRERSALLFNDESREDDLAGNNCFRHPKDAKEEEAQRQREKRIQCKQEDDIREMDAFATLVGSSVDKVRCAELPIEILGLSVDKTFRTRVLAAIAAGVVSVLLQVVSSRTTNDALQL